GDRGAASRHAAVLLDPAPTLARYLRAAVPGDSTRDATPVGENLVGGVHDSIRVLFGEVSLDDAQDAAIGPVVGVVTFVHLLDRLNSFGSFGLLTYIQYVYYGPWPFFAVLGISAPNSRPSISSKRLPSAK